MPMCLNKRLACACAGGCERTNHHCLPASDIEKRTEPEPEFRAGICQRTRGRIQEQWPTWSVRTQAGRNKVGALKTGQIRATSGHDIRRTCSSSHVASQPSVQLHSSREGGGCNLRAVKIASSVCPRPPGCR